MADFLRDDSGDLFLCEGNLIVIADGTEVLQAVQERLRSFAGEFFLDSEGLPYLTDIWGRSVNYRTIHALLLDTITQTEGVSFVSKYEVTLDTETRRLNVACQFQTIYDTAESLELCLDRDMVADAPDFIQDLLGDNIEDLQSDPLRDLS